MFSIGMNRSIFEDVTMRRSNPDESNLTSGVLRSAEAAGAEKNRFDIISNSVVRENVCSSVYSHTEIHGYNCHGSNIKSGGYVREENDPFSSYKKDCASASLTHLNQEFGNSPNRSTLMISETKGDMAANFGSSWSRLKDGSIQLLRDSCSCYIPFSFQDGGRSKGIQIGSSSEPITFQRSINQSRKVEGGSGGKMLKCSIHGNQMIRESTISSEAKGTAFFQMPTSPTMSYFNGQRSSSRNDQHRGNGMDMETLNGSSDKANTIYVNVSQTPSSAGLTSLQKDLVCSDPTKFEPIAASPIRQSFFNNQTYASDRALSTTKTDENNSHSLEPDNWKPLLRGPSIQEETERWIKRLRHNPSDSLPLSSKRFKRLDYGEPNPTSWKNMSVKKKSDSSSEEWKSMQCWIRRWSRRKADGSLRSIAPVLCEPEKFKWSKLTAPINFEPKVGGEDFEGGSNLPSIMGMALMGNAAIKFRPCKFRQKGSCLVWNVEGF